MAIKSNTNTFISKPKLKRPGVHSKNSYSKIKTGKNYKKKSIGQG